MWMLSDTNSGVVQHVTVGQLKGTQAIPDELAQWLRYAGITPEE
jgi:hypothetical protein